MWSVGGSLWEVNLVLGFGLGQAKHLKSLDLYNNNKMAPILTVLLGLGHYIPVHLKLVTIKKLKKVYLMA